MRQKQTERATFENVTSSEPETTQQQLELTLNVVETNAMKGKIWCFTLNPHRSWFALLLPEVVDPHDTYNNRNNPEREVK